MTWTEKYRPKNLNEIRGQEEAVSKIRSFFKSFPDNKKALILHGPPGIGKTTLAYALASEESYEIFELNASDFRNKEKIQEVLKPAIEQKSLTNKGKIILIDEVDGMSEGEAGGITALLNLIETTSWPIIITANDAWNRKMSSIRNKSDMLKLKEID